MKRFLFAVMVILAGCKSSEVTQGDAPLITMKKTPCFGFCPDYDITIYENGFVELDARQHLEIQGKFTSTLSKEQLEGILEEFKTSDFQSFEDSYTTNKTDLPTTYLTLYNGTEKKSVRDYDGAPKALRDLEKTIHELVTELEWKAAK